MEKKIMGIAIICLICSLVAILFTFIYVCSSQNKKIHSYEEYYTKTESLLDKIADEDDDFLDTTCETDAYCDYIEVRNKLE